MDITLTVTVQQATRISTALGNRFALKDAGGLPRQATQAEIKDYVIGILRSVVLDQERQDAVSNAVIAGF